MEPILRGALDDLRLIIDSADPMEGDLLVVLSNFRARNERRVQAGGCSFLWQVTDLPALPDFGPHKILQVLRILQEALTNVLKHARRHAGHGAHRLGDGCGRRTTVIVDVIDDGTGSSPGNGDAAVASATCAGALSETRRIGRALGHRKRARGCA